MKKLLCLLLVMAQLLSFAACQQEEKPVEEQPTEKEEVSAEKEPAVAESELHWASAISPVEYEMNWNVQGTTETYVRELCDPKYQGRSGGSAGNRAAADWIEEQFIKVGLQQLPSLEGYKQSYKTDVNEVLPGEAAVVAPDGTETVLEAGVDWLFKASPEAINRTAPLSNDKTLCDEDKAFWDGTVDNSGNKRYTYVVSGDVSKGMAYTNADGDPSRILVSEEVYQQLKQAGYQLRLNLPDAVERGMADNVIGYLPGKDSTKAVVLGANFDGPGRCGTAFMPAAYNNASGVATLIQTAEWLAQAEELPCDVIFAAFNTEDSDDSGAAALSDHIDDKYTQFRMVSLKCIGWKGQPLTIYGENDNSTLRNSLAGGLELQYKNQIPRGDETKFQSSNMSSVALFQDACLNWPEATDVLSSTRDVPENLDYAQLDDIAKKLATWVIERGDEPLKSYIVYW